MRFVGLAGLAAGLLLASACAAGATEPPRLVLVLVVDQLRADRLDDTLPGGLGRLAREGRVFADGLHDHAHTDTCPGHAVLLAGRHPGRLGVPGNVFVERDSGERVYCVQDDRPEARVHRARHGRSPELILGTMLGDWLKERDPDARVYAVAGKDRSAIAMGGNRADAAYWLERSEARGFTTSRYYRKQLPEWVERFNGHGTGEPGFLERVPRAWEHPTGSPANGARRDDYAFESDRLRRSSPHPAWNSNTLRAIEQILATPYADAITLRFARWLIQEEALGQREATDLLALSLSSQDFIGHLYGPFSQEARDGLRRLDVDLERFLGFLEERVGADRLLVVLTSDHGVMPVSEWLVETGESRCPIPGGRADVRAIAEGLDRALGEALDPPGARPEPWTRLAGFRITLNRERAERYGVPLARVRTLAAAYLARVPGVARVWTSDEIASSDDPGARLYRNSWHPERSGDLEIETVPTCLFSTYASEGTNHGTPHVYDRAVPIVFFGPGVDRGVVRGRARTIDIAPTLARALGLEPPGELDGEPLPLRDAD